MNRTISAGRLQNTLLIAHRGNTNGPNRKLENSESHILSAVRQGFHVEVDVWFVDASKMPARGVNPTSGGQQPKVVSNQWYLGHDKPQYNTTLEFLKQDKLICHAKNIEALQLLVAEGIHCFSHNMDDAVLTSRNKLWLYPGKNIGLKNTKDVINVMPEWYCETDEDWMEQTVKSQYFGICSDYVSKIREMKKL
jgi:hypothetical protein